MIDKNKLTKELLADVENHELVGGVETVESIDASAFSYDGNEYGNSVFLREDCQNYRLFNEKGTGYQKEIPSPGRDLYFPGNQDDLVLRQGRCGDNHGGIRLL